MRLRPANDHAQFMRPEIANRFPIPALNKHTILVFRELKHPTITGDPQRVENLVRICHDPYEACMGSHAIAVCTEWDEFKVGVRML